MLLNVEESYAGENKICSKVLLSYNTTNLNKAVFIKPSSTSSHISLAQNSISIIFIHTITVHFNVSTFILKHIIEKPTMFLSLIPCKLISKVRKY